MQICNVYDLRDAHIAHHPGSHFLDQDTLEFYGEALESMVLLNERDTIADAEGETHTCYVLSAKQRGFLRDNPRRVLYYFDGKDFELLAIIDA